MPSNTQKETMLNSIVIAFENLGGHAPYAKLYKEVYKSRKEKGLSLPRTWQASIRKWIELYSSDSEAWNKKHNLFKKINSGHWGLRSYLQDQKPVDYDYDNKDRGNKKAKFTVERYIRDTVLTKKIKSFEDNKCQLCEETILLSSGKKLSEAHHIKPLGKGHKGSDRQDNIIIVCPSCHAKLDYLVIPLTIETIKQRNPEKHHISEEFIRYHNDMYKKEKSKWEKID